MRARRKENLPASLDGERFVLGSILLDDAHYTVASSVLKPEDFSLQRHQLIFRRMGDLVGRSEKIDRLTVANELMKHEGELDLCDGLSYLVSLDDGLPHIPNLDSYVKIVKDKATLRRVIHSCQAIVQQAMMQQDEPNEILRGAEATFLEIATGSQQRRGEWLLPGEVMSMHPGGINAFLSPPRGGTGIPMPWKRLTEKTGGLHAGHLTVIAGRPSMGKSLIMMEMAHHAATLGHHSAIFSLDMTKEDLVGRLICSHAAISYQRFRTGNLDKEERRKVMEMATFISELPIHIDDTHARSIGEMKAALRTLMAKHPIRIVGVDHLQLMKTNQRGKDSRYSLELGDIAHEWKYTAIENDQTVLLCSQLNRQCEIDNRRPQQSDLKETGAVEEDANEILFVHRPERYAKNYGDPKYAGLAEFILAKQKEGATGIIEMGFLKDQVRFVDRDNTGAEPPPESPVSDDLYAGF
jgi:replicative DNA helicase